ncbi:MAG: isoleucine--tRNA ligase, partial [Eubacteriaceae bacterium]|nr:isoleucine--tRNA ligase [Eubacteriaceae bacterium]
WVFYEGPPTANGNPGIHHVIARTLKDSVNKFKTMQGYHVVKKAGWDTHGLPVEIEVEKKLNLHSKKEIEEYGVREFNKKCRESVFEYEALWREMTDRMAYFVDMDEPYTTLKNDYIESEWWILDKFFREGLMYEGNKILPYCPRCGTGLASHEVSLGYESDTTDTVYVKFRKQGSNESFLVWTTTPWTLASNVALAVGADITYIKAKVGDEVLIMAEARAPFILGSDAEILSRAKGFELAGESYEPLMPFLEPKGGKSHIVLCAPFVTIEEGTGIVHIAPAFGEDDYELAQKEGLAFVNPVNERGEYTDTIWKGMEVLKADPDIIAWLKKEGMLFKAERIEHNYPHCWRCHTPLLYYAKPSWYIKMTALRDSLIAANEKVEWHPAHVGEKRFGNWLENVKDWAISRNRYWGTPLNIWRCACGHLESVSSRSDLVEKSIENIDESIELHRPDIDEVHIICPECAGAMERVKDVIDCWFDSGAMPYAQYHYPFENAEMFHSQFPADFICEGIDQTRGWFYSLIAIGTFLTGSSPYRRVLVNDLILDKNGQKMSKSRGNSVDPFAMFDIYGADALRWYLLHVSPAWQPTKFDEAGLREVLSKFFSTYRNAYSFFALYANADSIDASKFAIAPCDREELDRWLLSRYNSLLREVTDAMESFDMTRAVRLIQEFVNDDLSNWYIRRSRRRFWESGLSTGKKAVYQTAYEILVGLSKITAPFAPYISEEIYRAMTKGESVHLESFPQCDPSLIDEMLERKITFARDIVSLGRSAREEAGLKVRQPLRETIVGGIGVKPSEAVAELVREELNVKNVSFAENAQAYLNYSLKPNYKVAGKALGKEVKNLASYLAKTPAAQVLAELESGSFFFPSDGGQAITSDMLDISATAKEGYNVQLDGGLFVVLNTDISPELVREGFAREIVSKVQQLRKSQGLDIVDRIKLYIDSDAEVLCAAEEHKGAIASEVLATEIMLCANEGQPVALNGHSATILVSKAE